MANAIFGQVLTAMVTPFHADGSINDAGVIKLVNHLLETGSDGIVVCGTTGESPTLSHSEKLHLFRLVKQTAGKRGTVIAGTGGNDTAASIELTKEAAEIGVDGALLVVPPYNKPSMEGLYRHFRAIAECVPNLNCMVYNVPSRTAQNMDTATTVRLAKDIPNIVATKEASGNLVQMAEIVAESPSDFAVYSGDDGLTLPLLAVGGVGVVSVIAHLVGRRMKEMHTAFFAGELTRAACLNAQMLPILKACFQSTTPSPVPLKAGLNRLGIEVGGLRLPLVEANESEQAIMFRTMERMGLL
ncbi:MAG: 4-hydroxy-tetrahydrodipicolinate synthase [Armatimonadetes bacterium]|nr:4-hydroxy-tetrahydrodipicolinate synthase [Armatimonadota bacterium]